MIGKKVRRALLTIGLFITACGSSDAQSADASSTVGSSAPSSTPFLGPFVRPDGVNPVLSPDTDRFYDPMSGSMVGWESSDVFNPAAVVRNGKVCVLYRAEDNSAVGIGSRTSRIGLAVSADGLHMDRRPAPVLFPADDDQKDNEWRGGCEDPRAAETPEGTYVLLYTQWNRKVPRLAVATSKDLVHWHKYGPAFQQAYGGKFADMPTKSASILTKMSKGRLLITQVNGQYWMYWGEAAVYAATSPDCIHWTPLVDTDGQLRKLITPRNGYFDSQLTECGPPAVMTDRGIVLIYNGKNKSGTEGDSRYAAGSYCAGQVLFDAKDPVRPIGRLDRPFFQPEASFEKSGQYPEGTVFTEGLVYFKQKWFLYYGCADSKVGVAVFDPAAAGSSFGAGPASASTAAGAGAAAPAPVAGGPAPERISLNSDNPEIHWKIKPQSEIGPDSTRIYKEGYDTRDWVNGVVPGAVFNSYVASGLEKDPNYADNIYRVDKSKYDRNFWYRTEFEAPALSGASAGTTIGPAASAGTSGERLWLHFRGVNRKGEVFLNGVRLGLLDGFMERGDYDITGLVSPGEKNVLAVLVHWPGRPIPNHASPTYISSDSWDWMPAVPGLLQGITDEVYLTVDGGVTLVDPWIRTEVPSREEATVSLRLSLENHSDRERSGVLTVSIQPGNIVLTRNVTLRPGQTEELSFDTAKYPGLRIHDPALWWPNGYGDPNLYTCNLSFSADGKASDSRQIKFGIRQYSYDTVGGVFHIRVNGERIFVRGGSWGMSEYLLRCRGAEYDLKVKLHKEMHYNMIRNWIGSTTDEAFYDACDKYGIMVWDDFWLNSHPNLPDDVFAFNANAVEKIKRLRNHPSIAVWCGDNEGTPLPPLNGWLREDVSAFDGGDRWYQPNSHAGALTGSGPWTNFTPSWYFTRYPGGFGGSPGWGFRTEIGTAVFTTFESFKLFMPDSTWWPRNPMWDKHFFGRSAANAGPDTYVAAIDKSYGKATGIEDFCRKAQLVNLETNKALYEGWQHHMWDDASGVMTWMSQSAYPSMVWQTYDYYYDLTGAYWGVRKACEPIHIQWSCADNTVKVVNTTLNDLHGLQAQAIVYNMDGRVAPAYGKTVVLDAPSDTVTGCFRIDFNSDDLASGKNAYASSGSPEAPDAGAVSDGSSVTRWSSAYRDDEWVYVDLGAPRQINTVSLNWESAYGKAYKIQVSDDAQTWKDVYSTDNGKGGVDQVTFSPVTARYVKMQGIHRAGSFGYSLYDFQVYGKMRSDLSPVQFIRLSLKDGNGRLLSDNFYWRSSKLADYTPLNTLPPARLKVSSHLLEKDGRDVIEAEISNPRGARGVAFAVRVQAVRAADGERILPALQTDNYFTLMQGESRIVDIDFDPALLKGGGYKLIVEPYNDK